MTTLSNDDIAGLVEPRRYHRRLFTDRELFDLEMKRIFGRAWIYVAHESQISEPGDYVTTRIGTQPVLAVRGADGAIHVLHNRCGHKGATVVEKECGNARKFRCQYHGWIYNTDGSLFAQPHPAGYKDCGFDRDDPRYGMPRVARQAEYRGFIFASLSADGPDFDAFIREIRSSFDNMIDRSPVGRLELVGKGFRYLKRSNWKAFMDNLDDAMHPMVTHQSVGDACKDYLRDVDLSQDAELNRYLEIINPFNSSYELYDRMGVTACPYGNGWTGGESSIHSDYDEIPGYRALLTDAYGAERADAILSTNRHNTIVYPSMTLKGPIQNIRVVRPVSVDCSIIEAYCFRPVGAPDEVFRRNVIYSNLVNSPASMVGNDDAEMYERLQHGLLTEAEEWIDTSRYFGREEEIRPGVRVAPGTSDLSFRNMYQAWKDYMTGVL